MSSAMSIILQETPPEAAALLDELDGRALADQMERLDMLAERVGVPPLLAFYSMDPEQLAAMMNGPDDDEDDEPDTGEQFGDEDEEPDTGEEEKTDERRFVKGSIEGAEAGDRHEDDGSGAFVEQWFQPAAGRKTVQALIRGIEDNPRAVAQAEQVLADLSAMERILEIAEGAQIPFHVSLDD